jgi:5-deoxy-glucuronate isomerase
VTALLEVAPASGSAFEVHLEPRSGNARLGAARGKGPVAGRTTEAVAWLLVEGGEGRLRVATSSADVGGRDDVFEGAGWSMFIPPDTTFSVEGPLRYSLVWRRAERPLPPRIMPPSDVTEEARGTGASARLFRTYLPNGPLIAGETINAPGSWSSYPPHRHEHEEVYLYRFDPPQGFGIALNYGEVKQVARMVHDGYVQRISEGYHPVVAAPGYTMYYLGALAGDSDVLTPAFDPVHAWLA